MATHPPPETCDFHGLPALKLSLKDGSTAIVTRFGAQVVSWIPVGSPERLYFSENAFLDGKQALRGGVPLIFPQFGGDGPLRHGFARSMEWEMVDARAEADFATVTFRLSANDRSRELWSRDFVAEMTVLLSPGRLDMELEIQNPEQTPMSFTAALHTYLRVQEVENVTLRGLQGHIFVDKLNDERQAEEDAEALLVDGEVDRIYRRIRNPLVLTYPRSGALAIQQDGFPDVVVWNPWEIKGPTLPDLPKDGFRRFLCVEAAAAAEPVCLDAGECWFGRQTLSVL